MTVIQQLAEKFFDEEIAPNLRDTGTPEYPIQRLRERYIQDIHENPTAIEELKEMYS